jgi:hypothetical protein
MQARHVVITLTIEDDDDTSAPPRGLVQAVPDYTRPFEGYVQLIGVLQSLRAGHGTRESDLR